jgi:two-component system, sensor histidine kinase and response regulator
MDVQMPGMNGFETTHLIRDEKSKVKNHRATIVAMTARAMKEDKAQCLQQGMNDYISKPVEQNKLNTILNRWLGSKKNIKPLSKVDGNFESIVDIEIYRNLKRTIGDVNFVLAAFIKDLPDKIKNISLAIQDNNPAQLELYAHSLKANCQTLGIHKLGEFCKEIEYLANLRKLDEAKSLQKQIEIESLKVIQILESEI